MSIAAEHFGDNVNVQSVNISETPSSDEIDKHKKKHSLLSTYKKKSNSLMEIQFTFNPNQIQQQQENLRYLKHYFNFQVCFSTKDGISFY